MMIPAQKMKTRSDDRILVLKAGEKPLSTSGLVDHRLFTGENRLHLVKDSRSIWSFKYDSGGVPEALKQKFTRFEDAYKHASNYFEKRDITIESVID